MNKVFATWGLLASLCVGSVFVGCSDDGGDPAGGAGSGTGGSGTAGSGTAGSGGGDAGAGGSSTAGSGGSEAAGSGGSGGSGQSGDMVAGCTADKATDLTAGSAVVTREGFEYKPACAKIKVGQSVMFTNNNGTHPLKGMTSIGTQPNPLAGPFSSDQTVTYGKAGVFGFYCTAHGGEVATQPEAGMAGAIVVVE